MERPDLASRISSALRDIPDFPEPGVTFKDITPLLDDHDMFTAVIRGLAQSGRDESGSVVVDKVIGMEARGFILAAPVALELGVGFVPVRKPGKLPWATHSVDYALEYGTATLQMHTDALNAGDRVLLVDDVLATGGTAAASKELVRLGGGIVHAFTALMELGFLDGRTALGDTQVHALARID